MQQAELIGQIIGGCRIDTLLGKGGMGYVFLAHHLNLDIPIALKLLNINMSSSPELIERFILEARAAAKLDSGNIVRVMQVGEERGFYYIQMEYVEGESLASYLKRNIPLDIPLALHFLKQIATGLRDAHVENIVHRDIKPDNVLINRKGVLKIADFGLVKIAESDNNLTATGQVLGTPYYISPEQCEGKLVDFRSDIYSLGIVMYYMLTAHLPFQGESSLVIVVSRLQKDPPPLSQYREDIPTDIQQLVEKMMQRNPQDRHKNTEELIDHIDELIENNTQGYRYKASQLDIQTPQAVDFSKSKTEVNFSSAATVSNLIPSQSSGNISSSANTITASAQTIANNTSAVQQNSIVEPPAPAQTVQTLVTSPPSNKNLKPQGKEKTKAHNNTKSKSTLLLVCVEILMATLMAFLVLRGLRKHQVISYVHIYDQDFGQAHSLVDGDAVKKYHRAITSIVDQDSDTALQNIDTFLNQYGYTPYAEVVKDLRTAVLEKKALLAELDKQLYNMIKSPMELKLVPPPLQNDMVKDNENNLRSYAKNYPLPFNVFFLSLEDEIQNILDKNLQTLHERVAKNKGLHQQIHEQINNILEPFKDTVYNFYRKTEKKIKTTDSIEQIKWSLQEYKIYTQKKLDEILDNIDDVAVKQKIHDMAIEIVQEFAGTLEKNAQQRRHKIMRYRDKPRTNTHKDKSQAIDEFFKAAQKVANDVPGIKGKLLRNHLKSMRRRIKRNPSDVIVYNLLKDFSQRNPDLRKKFDQLFSDINKKK